MTETTPAAGPLRAIAFYLPQYHPVPENDAWWGKGFTEWRNVTRARPLFAGHYQPHLPGELGFYDLRLPEVREAQAALAREYGIHGFCYYHYWFNGRRILERPFHEVLASGRPDFPFCLCWANENWTRRWDGEEREVLLGQAYGEADDRAQIEWLATPFRDPRYIRVEGRPLFLVYKASHLPDPGKTTAIWRAEARRLGVGELFLACVENVAAEHGKALSWGFDAAVEFAPDWTVPLKVHGRGRGWGWRYRLGLANREYLNHRVTSYPDLAAGMLAKPRPSYPRFPGVTPMWDNAARRKQGALVFRGSTPEVYRDWLRQAATRARQLGGDRSILFINAWNEWAEGNHLEPCQRWGRAYLEATREGLGS